MTGVTANGWPYITDTDEPSVFPTHSRLLAQRLELSGTGSGGGSGGSGTGTSGTWLFTDEATDPNVFNGNGTAWKSEDQLMIALVDSTGLDHALALKTMRAGDSLYLEWGPPISGVAVRTVIQDYRLADDEQHVILTLYPDTAAPVNGDMRLAWTFQDGYPAGAYAIGIGSEPPNGWMLVNADPLTSSGSISKLEVAIQDISGRRTGLLNADVSTGFNMSISTDATAGTLLQLMYGPYALLTVRITGQATLETGANQVQFWRIPCVFVATSNWSTSAIVFPRVPQPSRMNISRTTAWLMPGTSENFSFTLAPGYRILRFTADAPCRFRCYTSIARRTADANRLIGTEPIGNHGVVLEYIAKPHILTAELSPVAEGFDAKEPPDGMIPCTITNTGTIENSITVTLTWMRTE